MERWKTTFARIYYLPCEGCLGGGGTFFARRIFDNFSVPNIRTLRLIKATRISEINESEIHQELKKLPHAQSINHDIAN